MGLYRITTAFFLILLATASVSYGDDVRNRQSRSQDEDVAMQLRDAVGDSVEKGTIGGENRDKNRVGTVCIDSVGRRHYWTRKSRSEKMNYRRCMNEVMELLDDESVSEDDAGQLN